MAQGFRDFEFRISSLGLRDFGLRVMGFREKSLTLSRLCYISPKVCLRVGCYTRSCPSAVDSRQLEF